MLEVLYYEFGCPDLTNANHIVGEIGRRVKEEEGYDSLEDQNDAVICLYSSSEEDEVEEGEQQEQKDDDMEVIEETEAKKADTIPSPSEILAL